MRDFEYFEPVRLEEAVSLLGRYGKEAKLLAGGTDLLVTMKQGVVKPSYIINIKRIPDMNSISHSEGKGFRIGSLTTLREVESFPLVRRWIGVLAQAARQVSTTRIRSLGTIGGNLCQDVKCVYYPWAYLWRRAACHRAGGDTCYLVKGAGKCQAMATSDLAPVLVALGAKVVITGRSGEKTVPVEQFFVEAGMTVLQEDELLTTIEIPDMPLGTVGVYLKHSRRGAVGFAIAGVAVVLTFGVDNETCNEARISLIGVGRTPLRASKAEAILKGQIITESLIEQVSKKASAEARPVSDIHGSADYRRRIVGSLARQAIFRVWDTVKTTGV